MAQSNEADGQSAMTDADFAKASRKKVIVVNN